MITLGGRRRLARVQTADAELFAIPGDLAGDSVGLRLILATPGRFRTGWLPDELAARGDEYRGHLPGIEDEVILRAALVPPPLDLSTWDMRRRAPRPTWRLVRPGAVYYFDKASKQSFTPGELQSLWLAQLGGGREEGFGLLLPGRWQHD
jgi:CRISPR-associated protein Cmr3